MTNVDYRAVPGSSTVEGASHNEQAWLDLTAASRTRVTAYLRRVTTEPDEISELSAEVYSRAWINREDVLAATVPESVIIGFARAVCVEWGTWRRRLLPLDTVEAASFVAETERSSDSMSVEEVTLQRAWSQRMLSQLSESQRLAVDYRYRWSWSYDEIAAALGCSEATARVHVWRGLQRLRTLVIADPPPMLSPVE